MLSVRVVTVYSLTAVLVYLWVPQSSQFLWSWGFRAGRLCGMLCLALLLQSPWAAERLQQGVLSDLITSLFLSHIPLVSPLFVRISHHCTEKHKCSSTTTSAPLPASCLPVLKDVARRKWVAAYQCCAHCNVVRSCGIKCVGRKKKKKLNAIYSSLYFSTTQHLLAIFNLMSESVSLDAIKWMVLILETS